MRRAPRMTAAAVAVALLGTGCGGSRAGTASPAATTGAPSQAPTTSSKATSSRPREVVLDGKNPCDLLTAAQQQQLKVDSAPRSGTADAYKSPSCAFDSNASGYRVVTVVTEGIDAWRSGRRPGKFTEQPAISGFPAIAITTPGDDLRCDVAVDVANGQYLLTNVEITMGQESKVPPKCDAARQLAEAAMTTLLAQG